MDLVLLRQGVGLILQALTFAVAALALFVAWRSFRRQGVWRTSEEAQVLVRRLAGVEDALKVVAPDALLNRVRDAEVKSQAKEERLQRVEYQVKELREDIDKLPTREDLARLSGQMAQDAARVSGQIAGVDQAVKIALGGIDRLERFFLDRGVNR